MTDVTGFTHAASQSMQTSGVDRCAKYACVELTCICSFLVDNRWLLELPRQTAGDQRRSEVEHVASQSPACGVTTALSLARTNGD